ncbi:MAG: hypothetical protein ACR2OX_10860 [Methyloligellaceae bacterium]
MLKWLLNTTGYLEAEADRIAEELERRRAARAKIHLQSMRQPIAQVLSELKSEAEEVSHLISELRRKGPGEQPDNVLDLTHHQRRPDRPTLPE